MQLDRVLNILSPHIEMCTEKHQKMAGPWPSMFQKFLEVVTITRQKSDDDILETNMKDPDTVNLQVAGTCEHGNELSGSIKCREFLD